MKLSKIIIAIIFLTVFISNIFAQKPNKTEADKVWQMLEKGETENTFWFLTELFRQNGADIATEGQWQLKLKVQAYKEIINQYSNGKVEIRISRMMSQPETADYWENWSKVLAAGNFDQKKFFRNEGERFLLANFNVLVLSAHEIGHYLDYRYKMSDRDFSVGAIHDNDPLNCTENFADKFAVAAINHLAQDSRFAKLRGRYIELIKYFNSTIPEANRYNFDSYDFIGKRCGEPDLLKNGLNEDGSTVNENFFRQYTSAYFNRHRLMLENADYGDLSKIIQTELIEPFFKRLNYADAKISVKTLAQFDKNFSNDIFLGGRDLRDVVEFERGLEDLEKDSKKPQVPVVLQDAVFNEKGEPRFVELNWLAEKPRGDLDKMILREADFTLKIKDLKDKQLALIKLSVPKNLRNNFNLSALVMPTDSEIILVMTPFDLQKKFDHVVVAHLLKNKNKWTPRFVRFSLPELKDADEIGGNWFVSPGGKLFFLREQRGAKSTIIKLSLYEIDRKNFTASLKRNEFSTNMQSNSYSESMKKGLWRKYNWGDGVFGNDAGRLLITGYEHNLQAGTDANLFEISNTERLLLGNMDGIVDGNNQRKIKISSIISPRFISEKRVVFIDVFNRKNYLREIIFE